VKAYDTLKGVCGSAGYTVLLAHGRMSHLHRALIASTLRSLDKAGERYVAVATQVVEAGVDVDADALATDTAPVSSLIQRAGRVLRREVKGREGLVAVSATPSSLESCRAVYGVDCTAIAVELKKLAEARGSRVDWRYTAPGNATVYKLLLKPLDARALSAFESSVGKYFSELWHTILFRNPLEKLKYVAGRIESVFKGSVVRDSVRVPLIIKYRGVEDVVEAPSNLAFKLAKQGLIGGLRVKIYSESGELVSEGELFKGDPARVLEKLEEYVKRPLTFTMKLVHDLREALGSGVFVAVEGFTYTGVYDEERGLT